MTRIFQYLIMESFCRSNTAQEHALGQNHPFYISLDNSTIVYKLEARYARYNYDTWHEISNNTRGAINTIKSLIP